MSAGTPELLGPQVVGSVFERVVRIRWRGPALTVSLLPLSSTARCVSRDLVSPWRPSRSCEVLW